MFGEIAPKLPGSSNNRSYSFYSLRLTSLTPSQAIVSDTNDNLISYPYTPTNTPLSFVSRDGSGNFSAASVSFTAVNISGLTASQAVVTDASENLISLAYTNTNTPSTLVERDGSGNFSAGSVSFTGVNVSGLTASQAVVTDGSKNLASLQYTSSNTPTTLVERDGSGNFSAGTLNLTGANISGLSASQAVVTDGSKNLASLTYTSANTPTTLVERDGSGNFSAGTITASLTGHASLDLALTGGTMSGFLILNADPVTGLGAVTKNYADAISAGLFIKAACYAGTTGSNLNATYNNGSSGVGATLTNAGTQAAFSIDSISPPINSRILVKDQSSSFQNGIYTLTTVGTGSTNWVLTRATDYDQTTEIQPGDLVVIDNGTLNSGTGWLQTQTVNTIGTDAITFTLFNMMNAGTGLTRSGNTISLINPVAANLGGTGLGSPSPGYMLVGSSTVGQWAFLTAPSASQILGTDVLGGIFWLSTIPTLVQLNITSVGTIGAGTWQGTVISPTYGGTGTNNGSNVISIGGNLTTANSFTTSGNFAVTQIYTGPTTVTFPNSGTLSTVSAANSSNFVYYTYFGGF